MEAFHDSRNRAYRSPYGAVLPHTPVTLAIDVSGEEGASVTLRTWTDADGETLYPMDAAAQGADAGAGTRFSATIEPERDGVVWYQFVIRCNSGATVRYGARDGRLGGEGQLRDWEPPSFQLVVASPRIWPPSWNEPIERFLRDEAACHDLSEIVATARESYPFPAQRDDIPWITPQAGGQDAGAALGLRYARQPGSCEDSTWFAIGEDAFGLWRFDEAGDPVCFLANASAWAQRDVFVPMVREDVSELMAGHAVEVVDASQAGEPPCTADGIARYAHVRLGELGQGILHFHDPVRLQRPMEPGLGVLAHITSLPADGPATLGKPARAFVDWLVQAGVRYWQILPVNPVDAFGSPYAGISAFAGNERLLEGGGKAAEKALRNKKRAYRAFCKREVDWLEPYACFMAIRQKLGANLPWQDWPAPYRHFDAGLLTADEELAACAETWRQAQFAFDCQWKELRAYANERGVQIVGDMPIYVSADSADVWARPDVFQLGQDGRPAMVAGCPPDAFAADGQVWGNPLYDWDAIASDGHRWWLRRLERAFDLYDVLRLDHFIGFERYFAIPAGKKGTEGAYRPGPGIELFRKAHDAFGPLPIIAEDLGLIVPGVRGLVEACGFPGMDIIQFVDGNDPLAGYHPRPGKIAYTGTHDNQTLVGYVEGRYPGLDARTTATRLMESVADCAAPVCVVALQDLIGAGDEARMNVPGVADGNWTWQAQRDDMDAALETARSLVERHRRLFA